MSWATTEDAGGEDHTSLLLTPGVALYLVGKNMIAVNLDVYDPDFGSSEWSLKGLVYAYF